jgi:D-alanyl-D-alanine carboxypeptidase/D-alanyl-D-alanine-endopeptidase (penicillin-binding protein 4)
MREALRNAGIDVQGQALPAEEWPEDRTGVVEALLFTHQSPPLADILAGMLKPSQNQIAETLLVTVGRELRGEGTAEAGTAVVDSLLQAWNLPVGQLRMADGSGMSRYNLVSPHLLVALLAHMDRSGSREVWRSALPVAGVDGTLGTRMSAPPLRENVLAKTGTLTGVRSLSGYLTTTGGEPVAFSILVDHHLRSAAAADSLAEAALRAIAGTR